MGDHRRFFVECGSIIGNEATITGDTLRQIQHVLRLKTGDTIKLLDGSGSEFAARITSLTSTVITARIDSKNECPAEPRFRLSLVVCLPKGDKIELIVQKCTELGISELTVCASERTVSRPDERKAEQRVARWRKIAKEAAEQCGRARVPEIRGIVPFDEIVELVRREQFALVAWEEECGSLRDVLHSGTGPDSALVVVGPEGGLTRDEVGMLRQAGAKCVSLGRRVLRCETAGVVACALVMYEMESRSLNYGDPKTRDRTGL